MLALINKQPNTLKVQIFRMPVLSALYLWGRMHGNFVGCRYFCTPAPLLQEVPDSPHGIPLPHFIPTRRLGKQTDGGGEICMPPFLSQNAPCDFVRCMAEVEFEPCSAESNSGCPHHPWRDNKARTMLFLHLPEKPRNSSSENSQLFAGVMYCKHAPLIIDWLPALILES